MKMINFISSIINVGHDELTVTTESRAVMAKISAQETTPGQTCSTLDLIWSITSNPLTERLLGPAVFSPLKEDVSSRSIDPSHPCSAPNHKPLH